jgi:hypothetical protein
MYIWHRAVALLLTVGMVIIWCGTQGVAQQEEFSSWPEGASPQAIGKRVAENFIVRPYRAQADPTPELLTYPSKNMSAF